MGENIGDDILGSPEAVDCWVGGGHNFRISLGKGIRASMKSSPA